MADEVITAPTAEGSGAGTPSQVQAPSEQSDAQEQSTGSPTIKVGGEDQQTLQVDARPDRATQKPPASSFFHAREMSRVKRELDEIKQMLAQSRQQTAPTTPSQAEIPLDKFWENPIAIMKQMFQEFEQKLPQHLSTHFDSYQKQIKQREDSAYVDKLLAPDGELRQKDPQVLERLDSIIAENPQINEFSKSNFRAALEMALSLDRAMNQRPGRMPLAPKKASAQSTASGTAPGSQTSSIQELKTRAEKLRQEMEADPALKYNSDHRKKRQEVLNEITKLAEDANKG